MKTHWLHEIQATLDRGEWTALATVITAKETTLTSPGEKLLLRQDGSFRGDLGCPELAATVAQAFYGALCESHFYDLRVPLRPGGEIRIYTEIHAPTPEVVIIGAGHVGKAVAKLADFVALSVVVADDRQSFASPSRFPMARSVHSGPFEELLPSLPTHGYSYIVICTRGHKYDEFAVGAMLRKPRAYLGLLGSKRKALEIRSSLGEQGFSKAELDDIHTPVGLSIGAETPEEIAVSIIAEILSLCRSKGRFKVKTVNTPPFFSGEGT